ncbi:hypothetical protein ZWY2020_014357 [Hordeum vulgare]|nr:hypothetical protein ZWY2020_014357 [Hordeum vulgare]
MWLFYLISLPLTLSMFIVTLHYFTGPGMPRYVQATVGYAWFCSLSVIILVPADIWMVRSRLSASAELTRSVLGKEKSWFVNGKILEKS